MLNTVNVFGRQMHCSFVAMLFAVGDLRGNLREVLDRPEMGRSITLGVWLRGLLCTWVEQLLDPISHQQGYVQSGLITETWLEFIADRRRWGTTFAIF